MLVLFTVSVIFIAFFDRRKVLGMLLQSVSANSPSSTPASCFPVCNRVCTARVPWCAPQSSPPSNSPSPTRWIYSIYYLLLLFNLFKFTISDQVTPFVKPFHIILWYHPLNVLTLIDLCCSCIRKFRRFNAIVSQLWFWPFWVMFLNLWLKVIHIDQR